ncbi:MAG: hypothetical protein ABMB14_36890, partial [Myxococcota bacterium]
VGGMGSVVIAWLFVWLGFGIAEAQEPAPAPTGITITRPEDIYAKLPPPGATQWDSAPLVAGVTASTFPFTPKHYYDLLDHEVPPEILRVVAAKAAVFYDPNALPLPRIAANARRGAPKSTVQLDAAHFVVLFEFFNDAKNDLAEADTRVGPLAPRGPSETVNLYERRVRARDEALAKARGPVEGRIEGTTFMVDLPATVAETGGCKRSVATADMSAIAFELFRGALGTIATTAAVKTPNSPTIEAARFTLENPRRFEVIGRCGTTGTKLRMTLTRTFDGTWSGQGGF